VEKSTCPKVNENKNTEFHPMGKRPAFGCTISFNGMCFECKNHYKEHVRNSPKKSRVAHVPRLLDLKMTYSVATIW
jgi:hypothetical protein